MAGEEQAIIAFIVGLVCCLGTGVSLLAVGGFLLWRRSASDATETPVAERPPEAVDDDGEDTLVSERPSAVPQAPMEDGPSIATSASGAPEAQGTVEPPRRAAQTIIAFDADFDDDEDL